ncbi:hypothetical protein A2886_02985 [candidate division WWE3 bacterium RIFCSPHIGHO2_01_FULL_42_13]|uniref:Uncharacterized protein n=1 Tax=candidate division WWE3 bacterium RIFCSPHIGHO2_01_FULL_42_13 TaxID=1802617 RepID=A0A1F4US16_UNCKA|nr:MAG: hypothetical protein A2886_02985 [candidate division WWE3 bacterium RIFCSPHIGHO2_01_FULL_42_13]
MTTLSSAETLPTEASTGSVQEILKETVEKSSPMENESHEAFEQRKEKQREIIDVMPGDLIERIEEDIRIDGEFKARRKEPKPTLEDKKHIATGEIFESLASTEYKLREQREPSELSLQILKIYKNPPEALTQAVGHLRNPDLIDIREDTSTHKMVITGLAEVKMATLDVRTYEQQVDFRESLENVIETVKEMAKVNLDLEGFEELLENSDKLEIAAELHTVFVLPAERDIANPRSLVNEHDFKINDSMSLYYELVDGIIPEQCTLQNSVFTAADIRNFQKALSPLLGF